MALPLGLLPTARQRFFDANGAPLSNGYLQFFVTNTSTPLAVYDAAQGGSSLGVEVDLDAEGYAPAIFLQNQAYTVDLYDQNDNLIWSVDGVEDVGATNFNTLGLFQSQGARDVASGYTLLSTDLYVTTDATDVTDPFILNLGDVTTRTQGVVIDHRANTDLALTPQAPQTIDGITGAFTIAAQASPNFIKAPLLPDAEGSINWLKGPGMPTGS